MRKILLVLMLVIPLMACTPTEMALFRQVYAARTSTCHGSVDILWPSSSRAWAHSIVNRESRGIATAQNRYSTAAGCFQLLQIHAWRFDAVGCSWSQRYNAYCNVKAALHLYREAGTRPWGGSSGPILV